MSVISYSKSALTPRSAKLAADAGTPYTLTLKNESGSTWSFYVFQQLPQQSADVFSLAWFASETQIVSGGQVIFQWDVDYGFVWSETGQVIPGVVFNASQVIPADPSSANLTTFSDVNNTPSLSTAAQGSPEGTLVISQDGTIPANKFAVGICMSGAGTFVVPGKMNVKASFTPTPPYWIAAGTQQQVGTILDITQQTQAQQVEFPANTYELTYILNGSNVWVPQTALAKAA
jgi:rhizosphere induced protein